MDICVIECFEKLKFLQAYESAEPERKRIAALFKLLELHRQTEPEHLAAILAEFHSKNPPPKGERQCVSGSA
jgi:hypothetical protein